MAEFAGTARFEVRARLGAGGMGVVYRALDREQGVEVALKCFQELTPSSILELKHEFRRMRDIRHVNLVSLGELVEDAGQWFFTMELIEGVDALRSLRPSLPAAPQGEGPEAPLDSTWARRSQETETVRLGASPDDAGPARLAAHLASREAPAAPLDWDRARALFRQLARGIAALHAHGLLHRDIKPSNTLVDAQGRAVLLDFGITEAMALQEAPAGTPRRDVRGTPLYLAPEVYAEGLVSPAADWYSLGMMLYEALVGHRPLRGRTREILEYKRHFALEPPRTWNPDIPEDLDALCCALLSRDPAQRPTGDEVLARLAPGTGTAAPAVQVDPRRATQVFVGREDELALIGAALAHARAGRGRCVLIEGESGLGKTALAHAAVAQQLECDARLLVLRGRSHERESVPFKALDSVVDELTAHLRTLTPAARARVLPVHAELLATLFPVLSEFLAPPPGAAPAPRGAVDAMPREPEEIRRLAFRALGTLLAALCEQRPVLVLLEDLHWADADSWQLLWALLQPLPPVLLLITARPAAIGSWEDARARLQSLLEGALVPLPLGPLSAEQGLSLLLALAPGPDVLHADAQALVTQARGHPLSLQELLRHVRAHGAVPGTFLLDDALVTRAHALGEDAVGVLKLVALAAAPLGSEALLRASRLDATAFARAVTALSEEQLLRRHGLRRRDTLEAFHDRIREVVAGRLTPEEARHLHRQLAGALEHGGPEVEPETLAIHWEGAGEPARARLHAERAAEGAEAAFAFERAARLYRSCLALTPAEDGSRRRRFLVRLGDALTNGGHTAEAGAAYLEASGGAERSERVTLKRLAAERFLQSGHVERGMPQLADTLREAGLALRRSPWRVVLPLLLLRLRIFLRGLDYEPRPLGALSREELQRMDAAQTGTAVLLHLDPFAGAEYGAQFLLWALDSGEEGRIAKALALEYTFMSSVVGSRGRRVQALIADAERVADRIADPRAQAYVLIQRAAVAYSRYGRFEEALDHARRGEHLLRSQCHGVSWELTTLALYHAGILWFSGRWAEMKQRVLRDRASALARGDFWAAANVCSGGTNCIYLMDDAPGEALHRLDEGFRTFPASRFYLAHAFDVSARANIDLYTGDGAAAHARVEAMWKSLEASFLLQIPLMRTAMFDLRARAALGAALQAKGSAQKGLVAQAEAAGRKSRHLITWSPAHALLARASVAHLRGNAELALEHLAGAEAAYDRAGMAGYVAYARCARGRLLGGDEGRALLTEGLGALHAEGIARPERLAGTFAVGFGLEG